MDTDLADFFDLAALLSLAWTTTTYRAGMVFHGFRNNNNSNNKTNRYHIGTSAVRDRRERGAPRTTNKEERT